MARRKPIADDETKTDLSARRTMNLALTEDAYRRLNHHAIANGTTVSALVTRFALSLPEYAPKPTE
jgi:hypothetical protein